MQGNGYDGGSGASGSGAGGGGAKSFRYRDLVQVQWSTRANNRYVVDKYGRRRPRRVRRSRHIKGRLFMLAVTVALVVGASIVNRH